MTAPVLSSQFCSVDPSRVNNKGKTVKYLAQKTDVDFRMASRRDDANKLRAAFNGPTQAAISTKASRALGVSPRQIIYWMKCENDMPSWAVKAVEMYLRAVDRAADRIAGGE